MLLATLLLFRVPFWQRSRGRRIARYLVLGCYLYFGSLIGLLAAENWILFPGAILPATCEPPDSLRVRKLFLSSSDGNRIRAWFSAPEGWKPHRGAVLFSHGNGDTLCTLGGVLQRWRDELGRAVVFYDYPGYGESSGRPSEAGCYAAGEAAFAWLTREEGVPPGEIILVGQSLGGATAVELSTRHAVRLLVLHAAFTSFPDVAQARLPWYPARYLVHNQMNNERKIGRTRCPVLIAQGTADRTVPFAQGKRLFAAAREPKKFLSLEGEGHVPAYKKTFFDAILQFLSKTAH